MNYLLTDQNLIFKRDYNDERYYRRSPLLRWMMRCCCEHLNEDLNKNDYPFNEKTREDTGGSRINY